MGEHQKKSKIRPPPQRRRILLGWNNALLAIIVAIITITTITVYLAILHTSNLQPNYYDISLSSFASPPQRKNELQRQMPEASTSVDENNDSRWWRGKVATDHRTLNHPYMGARHPNGTIGMLVDPSPKRMDVVDITTLSNVVCLTNNNDTTTGAGLEGGGGHKVLQKVRGGMLKYHTEINQKDEGGGTTQKQKRRSPRILCLVYSVYLPPSKNDNNGSQNHHKNIDNHTNLRSVAQTWGQRCDGFFGASNLTDHTIGAIDLPHMGNETYGNMWQKVRSMWAYATNYIDEYDWFHIIGDDSYVVVDNLRSYLNSEEVTRLENGYLDQISSHGDFKNHTEQWVDVRPRPLVLGLPVYRRQRGKYSNGTFDGTMIKTTYPAGGSGYTLNRAALQLLQKNGLDAKQWANIIDSREDVLIGALFAHLGVCVSVTIDEKRGGRYLESAQDSYNRDWTKPGPAEPKRMKTRFKMWHADGLAGVSETALSFHLKDDNEWLGLARNPWGDRHTIAELMLRYHAVLYNSCTSHKESR